MIVLAPTLQHPIRASVRTTHQKRIPLVLAGELVLVMTVDGSASALIFIRRCSSILTRSTRFLPRTIRVSAFSSTGSLVQISRSRTSLWTPLSCVTTPATARRPWRFGKVAVRLLVLSAAQQVSVGPFRVSAVQTVQAGAFTFATGTLTLDDVPFAQAVAELNR